jgi:hypothetical protein
LGLIFGTQTGIYDFGEMDLAPHCQVACETRPMIEIFEKKKKKKTRG